ncbi:MAG: Fe-S cluster assembly protein SufD [Rhodospirillales bacterium]|nr:Fe-S cluster assembly protein SufD [Rhodospirillales bacterium]
MKRAKNIALPYAETFGAAKASLPGGGLPWLAALRKNAAGHLTENGLPSRKVEAWKYTNLAPLAESPLCAPDADASVPDLPQIEGTHRLVFVGGQYRADLSDGALSGVSTLGNALDTDDKWLADNLGRIAKPNGHAVVNANTAFMNDGCVLRLAEGAKLDKPLHLVFASAGSDGKVAAHHPRILIVAEKESQAEIIESHVGAGAYWANPVSEVEVGEAATVRHIKVQADSLAATHLAYTRVIVATAGRYDSFVMTTGAALSRSEIDVVLDGEDAKCRLNGVYMLQGSQHSDISTTIDHAKPRCDSDETYKGVLDGNSRGIFQGKIHVAPDAQQTNGNQLSRAILLSDGAEMNAKPELEIYADDVKCSHGATTGELDDDSMFYLRARGIPEDTARHLLIRAFIGEIVDEIETPGTRNYLEKLVENWLEREGDIQ